MRYEIKIIGEEAAIVAAARAACQYAAAAEPEAVAATTVDALFGGLQDAAVRLDARERAEGRGHGPAHSAGHVDHPEVRAARAAAWAMYHAGQTGWDVALREVEGPLSLLCIREGAWVSLAGGRAAVLLRRLPSGRAELLVREGEEGDSARYRASGALQALARYPHGGAELWEPGRRVPVSLRSHVAEVTP